MNSENQDNTGKNFFYKYYRVVVIPVVFVVYLSSYYFLNPYRKSDDSPVVLDWTLDVLIILLYCGTLTELGLYIGRKLNYLISWQKPIFRAIAQFVCLIIGNILLNYFFSYLWQYFYSWVPVEEKELLMIWQSHLVAFILSFFISLLHTAIFLLNKWRITSVEAAELKIKASELQETVAKSKLESLKLQLDPHFVFNNFSALTELIHEDPKAAASFLENITKVYRYMISNLNKDTITVKEELDFLDAYFYLLNKRLGEKVKLKLQIDVSILSLHLPPLTLQLLVENAVKHNMATVSQPLTIFIYSEKGDIVVRNNLQPTSEKSLVSTGIGHKNIEFRYKILHDRVPVYSESDNCFFVHLPLITK
ncbi:sensor histidine kinase [Flavobacterium aquicola]|uniref:Histidine kinase n=1 Tax=Flavobacterium aquicola TaxID=1682742 RepID=A0A3E0EMX1_9FLAO|nr:histidine kinase [Flavobacterium aquicola]REG99455.1 histidine kinase [Flavobacterium aquicola]